MNTEAKTEILEKLNENIKKMDEKSVGFFGRIRDCNGIKE